MARFIVHPGTPQAWEISLREGRTLIGRGEHNHFAIPDASVSTSHCEILIDGLGVRVKDLGSTNGTHVDRTRVTEINLQPGQRIRLGNVELLFEMEARQSQVVQLAPKVDGSVITLVAPGTPPSSKPLAAPIPAHPAAPPPAQVSSSRLQISKPHAPTIQPAPAPAPVLETLPTPPPMPSAPAPAAAVAQAISIGAIACKFHPKSAAQFMCSKCKKYYCSVCVMLRGTGAAAQHLCRTCGVDCVPVKSSFVASKTERAKVYTDSQVLMRCVGFGFVASLLVALIWWGVAALTQFDVVFLWAIGAGAACGFAVKIGSQDRPGAIFSAIAIAFTIVAIVLGKVAASLAGVMIYSGGTKFLTDVIGVVAGIALAWWLSGGDI